MDIQKYTNQNIRLKSSTKGSLDTRTSDRKSRIAMMQKQSLILAEQVL